MKAIVVILTLIFSPTLFAVGNQYYFVLDGSGSMNGTPVAMAKIAMKKMANTFLNQGDQVSVVVSGACSESVPALISPFFKDINSFMAYVDNNKLNGGVGGLPTAFSYTESEMAKNKYRGHIYLFGDGDELVACNTGINKIASKYRAKSTLTPFSYVGLEPTEVEEKEWQNKLNKFGGKFFNFKNAYAKQKKKVKVNNQFFKKPSYVNAKGGANKGRSFSKKPWSCIESDNLLWLSPQITEQNYCFVKKSPFKSTMGEVCSKTLLVEDYIAELDKKQYCGVNEWRLASSDELEAFGQLGNKRRDLFFPKLRSLPAISSTGGKHAGFSKGIYLPDASQYDYKNNKPYNAVFVSGAFDLEKFKVPDEWIIDPVAPTSKPTVDHKKRAIILLREEKNTDTLVREADAFLMMGGYAEQARALYRKAADSFSLEAMVKMAAFYDPRNLSNQRIKELDSEYKSNPSEWHKRYAKQSIRWYKKAIRNGDSASKKKINALLLWAQTSVNPVAIEIQNNK